MAYGARVIKGLLVVVAIVAAFAVLVIALALLVGGDR